MSSIAYVTDTNMIEYHRLCGTREMNFWRLSSKKDFKDFRKGDLLFFYARGKHRRKKGFVGYAHYVRTHKLSIKQMWKRYGTSNGYDNIKALEDAIFKAAKDRPVPEKMNCLYLTDAVFFQSPVYPEEVGLQISENLESFCYLDQDDPQTTVRILRKAEENGIDLWSASQSFEPENIFRQDEFRHNLALISTVIGKEGWNKKETMRAAKLAQTKAAEEGWEYIRNSRTDCLKLTKDGAVIAVPFISQTKNRQLRVAELIGKIELYRLYLKAAGGFAENITFEILYETEPRDVLQLVESLNNERL
ncbi:MAG: hypothetical protein Q4D24_00630 [Erysipelotrichaceae bacterium]|nr:hypothetical protein [Erysipelotrichaceae bacterium]